MMFLVPDKDSPKPRVEPEQEAIEHLTVLTRFKDEFVSVCKTGYPIAYQSSHN